MKSGLTIAEGARRDLRRPRTGFANELKQIRRRIQVLEHRLSLLRIGPRRALAGTIFLGPGPRAPGANGRQLDLEILEFFSRLELGGQPAWLLPAARPGLRRLGGISIFWKHLRVRSSLPLESLARCAIGLEQPQPLFELGFFRGYPARQTGIDFQVQCPELVNGHRLKILRIHVYLPSTEMVFGHWRRGRVGYDVRFNGGDTKATMKKTRDKAREP